MKEKCKNVKRKFRKFVKSGIGVNQVGVLLWKLRVRRGRRSFGAREGRGLGVSGMGLCM